MKKIAFIVSVLLATFGVVYFSYAQSIYNPNYWKINTASSTISPLNASLQVPCANIQGDCSGSGGGTTTINGITTSSFLFSAGSNVTITSSSPNVITISASAASGTATNVYGTNGVSVTQTGLNATATLDTSFAASWTALATFNKGITVNGTTTLASTTNALLQTNGSGILSGYGGASACPSNEAVTTISALGATTCSSAFVPQTLTVSAGGILSGGGALSSNQTITLTTSTLYSEFSASNPITFSTSTGAFGWTNSQNYIALTSLSASSPISYNNGTGAFTCATCVITSNNLSDLTSSSTARTNLGLLATSSLVEANSDGSQTFYVGSSFTALGNCMTSVSISKTGTLSGSAASCGGSGSITTSTAPATNTLPLWTGTSTLGNSNVSDIGTSTAVSNNLSVGTTTTSTADLYVYDPVNQTSTVMVGATSTATSSYRAGCLVMAPADVATGTAVIYIDFSASGVMQTSTSQCP